MNIKLEPFMVPNYVRFKRGGSSNDTSFSLGEISDLELTAMCEEFKKNVLAKAASMRATPNLSLAPT